MQKTNIRDRISYRKYYLARLTKQCLLVYACTCMHQSTVVSCVVINLYEYSPDKQKYFYLSKVMGYSRKKKQNGGICGHIFLKPP